jgi:hypothetical protein
MGFSLSWLGFEDKTKEEVLRLFGLCDVGAVDEVNQALFSAAELPNGWTILFVNDYSFGGDADVLAEVSAHGYVVVCQAEDHAMASAARGYRDGRVAWEVVHDSSRGPYDVSMRGQPPARIAEIRQRLAAEQRASGDDSHVDYLFDAPVELAASETGYRHDRFLFDWGQPVFTVAEVARSAA